MTHKIILDTDPGIDDAMAIFTAMAHSDIELLGLTTTYGNVSVEQATQNALTLVEMAGADIPVAKGVAKPMQQKPLPYPDFVHGSDGFGNLHLPPPQHQAIQQSAAEYIVEQVLKHPHEITLVAIGPLGNLAAALQLEPKITKLVKQVVIMGGLLKSGSGNVSPVAEANILGDPHAAEMVMAADWSVTMVGLDVTHEITLSSQLFADIAEQNPKVGSFMQDATRFYIDFYSSIRDIGGCHGHDVLAIAYVVQPELFETVTGSICVATEGVAAGQTIMSTREMPYLLNYWQDRPQQKACTQVDEAGVIQFFRDAMTNEFWSSV